ncbi:unnamed protein product [Fusarium graminearum]|nr:unnamed protein product [Fusarium graminearum]
MDRVEARAEAKSHSPLPCDPRAQQQYPSTFPRSLYWHQSGRPESSEWHPRLQSRAVDVLVCLRGETVVRSPDLTWDMRARRGTTVRERLLIEEPASRFHRRDQGTGG